MKVKAFINYNQPASQPASQLNTTFSSLLLSIKLFPKNYVSIETPAPTNGGGYPGLNFRFHVYLEISTYLFLDFHGPGDDNPWESMEIPRKSMRIHGNPWKSMKTYGNPWKSMKLIRNLWKSLNSTGREFQWPRIPLRIPLAANWPRIPLTANSTGREFHWPRIPLAANCSGRQFQWHFGIILGSFWHHFGIISESFWIISGSFWYNQWKSMTINEMDHFWIIIGSF